MRRRRRWTMALAPATCSVLVAQSGPVSSTTAAVAAAPVVRTEPVCFRVDNPGDPVPSEVHGLRYHVEDPRPASKVIVLVHGNSVTRAFWEPTAGYSVARSLAVAGYQVLAYDRLGYGTSPYPRPRGAGYTLTLSAQRAMLHQIVAQVKDGSYTVAPDGRCSDGSARPTGVGTGTVVLLGHSGGGLMVSGYPGTYHDVAAVIQVGWSSQGFSPPTIPYVARTVGPQLATGNDYVNLFPTPEDCQTTVLYPPAVVPSLGPQLCRSTVAAPAGEFADLAPTIAETLVAIGRVGPGLPVLLAWEDHDFFFSADSESAEDSYWKAHCRCDVHSWVQPETGHAFIAHRSMPSFVAEVVRWLGSRGLGADH